MQGLAEDINNNAHKFEGQTILICWEHTEIPKLIEKLGLHDEPLYWGLTPTVRPKYAVCLLLYSVLMMRPCVALEAPCSNSLSTAIMPAI